MFAGAGLTRLVKVIKALIPLFALLFTFNSTMYAAKIGNSGMFDNTLDNALPQTAVANMVNAHFSQPLPPGKTVKKCVIFGWDGARCDSLLTLKDEPLSAIREVSDAGALFAAYAGGESKIIDTQSTSTAPGWASILTGKWAKDTGVYNNGDLLKSGCRTVLTSLVESGQASSAVFLCSWGGHITASDATYRAEAAYTAQQGLDVRWETYSGDDAVQGALAQEVSSPGAADLIFLIYERPDSAGHDGGFGNGNPAYADAVRACDRDSLAVIRLIQARDTFDSEDWLFIIASDHGGQGTGHGAQTVECRTTFIATNKIRQAGG